MPGIDKTALETGTAHVSFKKISKPERSRFKTPHTSVLPFFLPLFRLDSCLAT